MMMRWRLAGAVILGLSLTAWALIAGAVLLAEDAFAHPAPLDAAYQCTPSTGFGYILIDDADGLAWTLTQPQAPQAIAGASVTLDAVTWQLADLAMIGLTAALVVLTALHQWGGHRGAV